MRQLNNLVALLLIASNIYKNEAAKILVVAQTPSISHQVVFRPLAHEFARRGHEVVVITADPAFSKNATPENLTEIDVHDISYKIWRKQLLAQNNGDKSGRLKQFQMLARVGLEIFEEQTKISEVKDIIGDHNNNFDLILVEAFKRFILGFSHVKKAPVIVVSSAGAWIDSYDIIGALTHPLLYHQVTNTRLYNLTLWDKVLEYYSYFSILHNYNHEQQESANAAVRRIFGEDTPALSELQSNVHMLFLNIHPMWESIRPVPIGVVYMGGIHLKPQKELPQDLKTYLDSSVNGVIYLSFGTNVDTSVLPPKKIQMIVEAFSQLPYDVLWKWNEDELSGRTKNIKISKWFPQSDLLKHPKIKLFITQGGLQSTDEAITAGVPLIVIPMRFDQWFNAEKYVHYKIGMRLELGDLEVESLKGAIKTIIRDESYRRNVIHLRTLMFDQPMTPLERAVWWTEHLLRHGGAGHLRAPAANMPWAQYYELELVLTVLSIATAVIVLSSIVMVKIAKLISSQLSKELKRNLSK